MHPVDFITELGAKYAPIDAHALKTMQFQLTERFDKQLENYKMKENENKAIDAQIKQLNGEAIEAEQNNEMDRKSDIAQRMADLISARPKPTIIEKACNFLSNPVVKFGLMILFGLIAGWIIKRKLSKSDEPEDEEIDQRQNYGYPPNGQYQPQPQYWQQPQQPVYFNQPPAGYKNNR